MGRGLATVCSVTAPLGGGGGCHVPLGHLKRAHMPVQMVSAARDGPGLGVRENFDPRNDALGRCCSIRRRLKVSTRRCPPQDCTRRAPNDPVPHCGCRACAHMLMGMHGECAWAWVLLRCTALKGLQGGARYVVWRPTRPHRIVPRMVPFVVHCTVHATLVHWAHVLHFSLDPLHLRCHRSFRKAAGARGMRRFPV